MGCAPTRIWRPGSLDRGVWHVSINFDTSNEAHQGPPDGTQGYLATCYRNIVDTKPSHFSNRKVESGIRSQVGSKIGKMPNGANPKFNRLTKKKKSTYLVPHWIITWADWCGARLALATNLLTWITVQRKFNSPYAISDQTSLLYANFVPTLISPTLYGLLYSAVMFLKQRTKDTRTNNPIDQSVDMYSARRFCCCRWLGVAPKMKKVRLAN